MGDSPWPRNRPLWDPVGPPNLKALKVDGDVAVLDPPQLTLSVLEQPAKPLWVGNGVCRLPSKRIRALITPKLLVSEPNPDVLLGAVCLDLGDH